MARQLILNPGQARSVIEDSEGKPGLNGAAEGHTKKRHVLISKVALLERMNERSSGDLLFKCAFENIHDCASLLSRVITSLGSEPFFRDFASNQDGAVWSSPAPVATGVRFNGRDHRGRFPGLHHVRLVLQKHPGRIHNVHLITFYPTIDLEDAI